jgi:hypothetical protein
VASSGFLGGLLLTVGLFWLVGRLLIRLCDGFIFFSVVVVRARARLFRNCYRSKSQPSLRIG